MADEFRLDLPPALTGLTITAATILGATETSTGNAMAENGSVPGSYRGSMPGSQAAGRYAVRYSWGGADRGIVQELDWDGTNEVTNVALASAIAGLAAATITLTSPLSSDGTELVLTTGDSYTAALGQSLTFNIVNEASLIGTIPHLRIDGLSSDLSVAPAITSGTQSIVFNDIIATTTSGLSVGNFRYQVRFMSGSDVATIVQGTAIVRGGI